MPSFKKIPREIREFVARFLPRIEHLEAFIVLQRDSTRSWCPSDIAAQLGIPESTAAHVLERLASANFLAVTVSSDVLYRFDPVDKELEALSARCADLYMRDPSLLINLTGTTATSIGE